MFLGQPLVFQHDGEGISLSIASQLESWGIQHFQIEGGGGGGGFDGQYFHLSVPEHLLAKLSLSERFIYTWDPLHKGGLVDAHIRVDFSFKWLG